MISGRTISIGAVVVTAAALGWVLFVGLPKLYAPAKSAAPQATASAADVPTRKINARLFYVAEDGLHLASVDREVPFAEGPVEQARRIIEAQIAPVAEPLVSAVPPGTKLRAIFLSERGEAFVDLSRDVVAGHAGGTTGELLTIYTLVNALTTNLPAVSSVQILVEGKEVPTLSGHIDLRRPLVKNATWVQ
jgi:spore germination protein GerM